MSARRKRGTRLAPRGRLRLQPRDRELLEWVGRAGVVDLVDLAALFFPTQAGRVAAARRVRLLADHGLVEVGVRALHESNRVRLTPMGADRVGPLDAGIVLRTRIRVTSAAADHLIASARVWSCLAARLMATESVGLARFLTEAEIRRQLVARDEALIPDAIAVLRGATGIETTLAVEVDLDTELARIVGRKARRYAPHLARAVHLYGVELHALLIVAPGRRRLAQLAAVVATTEAATSTFFADLETLSSRTVLDRLASVASLRADADDPFTTSLLGATS